MKLILLGIVLAGGIIALAVILRPVSRKTATEIPDDGIVIPLAEICGVWTKHNTEMEDLSPEEIENDPDAGFDAMFDNDKQEPPQTATPATAAQPAQTQIAEPSLSAPDNNAKEIPEAVVVEATPAPVSAPVQTSASGAPIAPATASEVPQPAPSPASSPSGKLSLSALAEPLKSLWDDCIVPYKQVIKSQGADAAIQSLLQIMEKHGYYPSVVIDSKDTESIDMITVRDNLALVTLRDHTYAVCRYMIGNLKESFKDYELQIPTALIASLAHDIGKIPEFRLSGLYNSKDHPIVSAGKLSEMIGEANPIWGKKAVRAVSTHHTVSNDDLTVLLKKADRQARQAELALCTASWTVKPFKEWFNLKKYLNEFVAPGVNVQHTAKGWNAFSHKGVIYARPDWLYEQARQMCHTEKALDLTFIYDSEKASAIRMIVSELRKENITPLLGEGYPARKFDIKLTTAIRRMQPMYLTAFTAPEYMNLVDMESRKKGFAEIIENVVPL